MPTCCKSQENDSGDFVDRYFVCFAKPERRAEITSELHAADLSRLIKHDLHDKLIRLKMLFSQGNAVYSVIREETMSDALVPVKADEARGELIQLVSFNLDQEEYGVDVLKVREIIRMPTVTRVPNTPHYVDGVINLRGKVIPIISMRKKFGLLEVDNDKQTRIMVMDVDGELMGFIVDAVSEVIRISGSEIQPSPAVVASGIDQECIAGVINQTDRLLVLLDLEKMFSQDERRIFGSL
jgi:purine-binding chemotaxis protein CheW